MRNRAVLDNMLLTRALGTLRERLPAQWTVTRVDQPSRSDRKIDALFEVRGPDGKKARILVEAKGSLTAAEVAQLGTRLESAAKESKAEGRLLVTMYLTPLARERLTAAEISYLDLTGNARISLDRPALFIESRGADRDPAPVRRGSRSLKGGSAARIVRALCDWRPPAGVREIARRAQADPGYVTRILTLLEQEDVISRDKKGTVVNVNWKDLLARWAQDYAVTRTNRAVAYLAPRGIDGFVRRLDEYSGRWALTGSRAVPKGASTAVTRTISCYTESLEQAASQLDLRSVDSGANVILLEPFDAVIWQRTRKESGLTCVAVSQGAVDLLTGTGREPSEGEALLAWMEKHESDWRA